MRISVNLFVSEISQGLTESMNGTLQLTQIIIVF